MCRSNQYIKLSDKIPEEIHKSNPALMEMINCFNANVLNSKHGHRYSLKIKQYLSVLRIFSGPAAYEIYEANCKNAVPSPKTLSHFIHSTKSRIREGSIRAEGLLKYLNERNLPLFVSLCEDATSVNGRLQYDSFWDEVIGGVLPLNSNGMPRVGFFEASTASQIESSIIDLSTGEERQPAHVVNVLMAQPIVRNMPPFCLSLFGSNNSYNATDVINRWNHISQELRKHNIQVVSVVSDGDPKFFSAMVNILKLDTYQNRMIFNNTLFSIRQTDENMNFISVQDILHIGTKLRNRLLNRQLKFGSHIISMAHLEKIINEVHKTEHGLAENTINLKDRQNFD